MGGPGKPNFRTLITQHLVTAIRKARATKLEQKKYIEAYVSENKLNEELLPDREVLTQANMKELDKNVFEAEDEVNKKLLNDIHDVFGDEKQKPSEPGLIEFSSKSAKLNKQSRI
jgi:hypothetical protein